MLYITDPATGEDLHQPVDIIQAIGQVKDQGGNYLYRTQEDIDRNYCFPIRVEIPEGFNPDDPGSLSIRISINDWVIDFPDVEIM